MPKLEQTLLAEGVLLVSAAVLLMLLAAPFAATLLPGAFPALRGGLRALFIGLFSLLAFNWIATESVLTRWQPARPLWLIATSLNGVCLVVLFVGFTIVGMRSYVGSRLATAAESSKTELES